VELPLERLVVQEMASGNASLVLTERVDWESFQVYAEAVLQLIGGSVVERVDSPVERVWTVTVGGELFWLAHDEVGTSLDSQSLEASLLIPAIRQTLLSIRTGTTS
jgi:hypothetical protein